MLCSSHCKFEILQITKIQLSLKLTIHQWRMGTETKGNEPAELVTGPPPLDLGSPLPPPLLLLSCCCWTDWWLITFGLLFWSFCTEFRVNIVLGISCFRCKDSDGCCQGWAPGGATWPRVDPSGRVPMPGPPAGYGSCCCFDSWWAVRMDVEDGMKGSVEDKLLCVDMTRWTCKYTLT